MRLGVLTEYMIGTGGWSYFHVAGLSPLNAYSHTFNFVEVNSTFYKIPRERDAERWRRVVPSDFEFSVRAHRSITHIHGLQAIDEVFDALKPSGRFSSIYEIRKVILRRV